MKTVFYTFALIVITLTGCKNQGLKSDIASFDTISTLHSELVADRNIVVWKPDGYSTETKYDVLYMHDGQMLFDSTTTWNKQEWRVDEVASGLIAKGEVRPFIVVAIENVAELRNSDYLPQKLVKYLPEGYNSPIDFELNSDNYLRYIVEIVKPYIDSAYSVYTDRAHTSIMGSSMGGLISLYALCEYPNVFGASASLSIHTPILTNYPLQKEQTDIFAQAFIKYIENSLPEVKNHKIYIDRGDQTLDSTYVEYHSMLENAIEQQGFTSPDYCSRIFPSTAHTERDWAARLKTPLKHIL